MSPLRSSRPNRDPIDVESLLPPFAPIDETSDWLFRLRRLGIRPGLEGIGRLLSELGHPERKVPSIVVAGTNGKGTAAIFLAALCRSAGLRTGLYTSPHLLSITERIHVDGQPVPWVDVQDMVERHREKVERIETTFFESLTGMVLDYFACREVDVAVLEAGLGGRLDATNAAYKKAVVLTSIGIDHQELLGDDLLSIAREKLGLAGKGIPFYLEPLSGEVHDFALDHLESVGSIPMELEEILGDLSSRMDLQGNRVGCEGEIQIRQQASMAACYEDLRRRCDWPAADPTSAYSGLRIPGRYEIYGRRPLLRVDTAHNGQALERLLSQWKREGRREDRILIYTAMEDKRVEDTFTLLLESSATVFVTAPKWYRATQPEKLMEKLASVASGGSHPVDLRMGGSVRESLEQARDLGSAWTREGRRPSILVTGSNFLVAEALDRLGVDDLQGPPVSRLWDEGLPLRRRIPRGHR